MKTSDTYTNVIETLDALQADNDYIRAEGNAWILGAGDGTDGGDMFARLCDGGSELFLGAVNDVSSAQEAIEDWFAAG